MEGSGTFGHFEFFASALDQHWVEGGSLSQLEEEKMQERMFAACFAGDFLLEVGLAVG